MDCLDFNLHQAILHSLATLPPPKHSDEQKLEQHNPLSTLGLTEDFLSSFRPGCESTDETFDSSSTRPLTLHQTNAIIALAEHVHTLATNDKARKAAALAEAGQEKLLNHIVNVLRRLEDVEIERCLGAQGTVNRWLLPDQLAYALTRAVITAAPASDSSAVVKVFETYEALKAALATSNAERVIEHLLPSIHGIYRAIKQTPSCWSSRILSSALRSLEPLSNDTRADLDLALSGNLASSSDSGRYLTSVLNRYEDLKAPLTSRTVCSCDLGILSSITIGMVSNERLAAEEAWQRLVSRPLGSDYGAISEPEHFDTVMRAIKSRCAEGLDRLAVMLDVDSDSDEYAEYEVAIVTEALRAGAAACVLESADEDFYGLLQSLLSEQAQVYETQVQNTALECVCVLVHRYPKLGDSALALLRRFITSPLPILAWSGTEPSDSLKVAASSLGSCIDLMGHGDMTLSTVYSLLHYLPSSRDTSHAGSVRASSAIHSAHHDSLRSYASLANRTPEERNLISANTLFAVVLLSKRFDNPDVTKLAGSMLVQRVRNTLTFSDQAAETVALGCVADLAPISSQEDFTDIARSLTEITRYSMTSQNDALQSSCLAAQVKLAGSLADKRDFALIFLRELLVLFMDQASPARPVTGHEEHHHHARLHRANSFARGQPAAIPNARQLHDTLQVIATLLRAPSFNPQDEGPVSEEIVMLFRNMWFLSVALGLLDSGRKEAQKHREYLRKIAVKTPCLVTYTPLNYVDTELEYNPLLRKEHGTSSEALRSELSVFIPSQNVIQARTISYPQVIFLLAVAKLETFRAESGDPSQMLKYFQNEGINSGPLADPLAEIAQKVTSSFLASFGHRVRQHAVNKTVAAHLKSMILACSHSAAKKRRAAIKALDSIFTVFPVLLCDATIVRTLLESLTLLRDACEGEFDDEYSPIYEYKSRRADVVLVLPDNYAVRNEMLATLHQNTKIWLSAALAAAPLEMTGLLQNYLDADHETAFSPSSGMGKGVALEIARQMPRSAREANLPNYGGWKADTASAFASAFGTRHTYGSEAKTVIGLSHEDGSLDRDHVRQLKTKLRAISEGLRLRRKQYSTDELRPLLYRAAAVILAKDKIDYELLREIVFIPVHAISPPAVHLGVEVWAWLVDRREDVEAKLMVDLHLAWGWTVRRRRGLFSILLKAEDPINSKTEYSPTDVTAIAKAHRTVQSILAPHRYLLEFISSRFQAYRYRDKYLVLGCMRLVVRSIERFKIWGKHPLCRELRMKLITLGFSILNSTHLEVTLEGSFRRKLYAAALNWFEEVPTWSYGADRLQLQEDVKAVQRLLNVVAQDKPHPLTRISTRGVGSPGTAEGGSRDPFKPLQQLLLVHLEHELQRLAVWINPLSDAKRGTDPSTQFSRSTTESVWASHVRVAWSHSPRLAVLMAERFKQNAIRSEIRQLVLANPCKASTVPEALDYLLGTRISPAARPHLKHLVHWGAVSPVLVLRYFLPAFNQEPLVLQYAMRVLEQHPVDLVFFYIPQVVQAIRTDPLNYMERFIFETSKISQLFCHQMIWTMKANCYKDDLAEEPDPDKERFERMTDLIVSSLSGEAQEFYEKEFGFFNEVTSISRKLMPFVKKTKPEKKAKIDEEMAKIKVEQGVYLPSHPEGQVVDIDRHSGRPLQSHAKTPFMATFKVSREVSEDYSDEAIMSTGGEHTVDGGRDGGANEGFPSLQGGESGEPKKKTEETKISAIFKVGDDCRQDVLALQVIAQFKNMFNVYGLDLQVQPYRVLATGPGTGIIDVVPNATSRDEMGRAKINDLTAFFLFQFGPAESVAFQRARNNFIQSMAAYSVLCYILQIKDRHNGNIMIDGEGRITHIDFGFLFDIGPGGIKFEPNSFKLTHEMITLMGGKSSQGYRQFCELTVKAFLACRTYVEDVVSTCQLMIATDLPSFKGEGTIIRLRDRFKPELTEREAARYMMGVIDNACENSMSIVYDQFQYFQNKIPYAS